MNQRKSYSPDLSDSGLTQFEKNPEALSNDFMPVDERDLIQSLIEALSIADEIHCPMPTKIEYRLSDELRKDVSLLLVEMIRIGNDTEIGVKSLWKEWRESEKWGKSTPLTETICREILNELTVIIKWKESVEKPLLLQVKLQNELSETIFRYLEEKYAPIFREVQLLLASGWKAGIIEKDIYQGLEQGLFKLNILPGSDSEKFELDFYEEKIRDLYFLWTGILEVNKQLRQYFTDVFYKSLHIAGNHPPHSAMLITFLQLMRHARKDLDKIAADWMDEELSAETLMARTKSANHTYAFLELNHQLSNLYLPAGLSFVGRDSITQRRVQYLNSTELEINQAKLCQIKTVFVSKRPNPYSKNYLKVAGIYAATYANSFDGQGRDLDHAELSWPTFGEEQDSKLPGHKTMDDGSLEKHKAGHIGFAISDPILNLKEGKRKLILKLFFEPSGIKPINQLIDDFQLVDQDVFLSREEKWEHICGQGPNSRWAFYLSGESGWIALNDKVNSLAIWSESGEPMLEGLQFVFTLNENDPPIIAANSNFYLSEGLQAESPVLKFILRNHQGVFLYSYLKYLHWDRLNLEVEVEGVRSVSIQNEIGRVEPGYTFQAFGPRPDLGNYFQVFCQEYVGKKLSQLNLHLNWHKLPEWESYYSGYKLPDLLSSESFKAKLYYVLEGRTEELEDELSVFPEKEQGGSSSRTIRLKPDTLEKLNAITGESYPWLRVSLTAPEFGFGHDEYQRALTQHMLKDAGVDKEEDQILAPNQPFIPRIREISIDYKARKQIELVDFSQSKLSFFHICPFGYRAINADHNALSVPLIPSFNEDAYLYLGLEDIIKGKHLSLFFLMNSNYHEYKSVHQTVSFKWQYLKEDEWTDFTSGAVLRDGTHGFTKTGLIYLKIPEDIGHTSQIMPGGLYWIRIAAIGDLEQLAFTREIRLHGVKLTADLETIHEECLQNGLAPNSLEKISPRVPGIISIVQPYPSFGGNSNETSESLRNRRAAFRSHRNLAIKKLDFERLILDAFPNIQQVKIIRPSSALEVLRLILIPGSDESILQLNRMELKRIESFVKSISPPSIRLEARSPAYEYIRIKAKLRFWQMEKSGELLQKLQRDTEKFINPWKDRSNNKIAIGGKINTQDLLEYLKQRDYVELITGFSIIHISRNESFLSNSLNPEPRYRVFDTARASEPYPDIEPAYPWSVLILDSDGHDLKLLHEHDPLKIDPEETNFIQFRGWEISKEAVFNEAQTRIIEKEIEPKENKQLYINL